MAAIVGAAGLRGPTPRAPVADDQGDHEVEGRGLLDGALADQAEQDQQDHVDEANPQKEDGAAGSSRA